jgi:hypothetical protein
MRDESGMTVIELLAGIIGFVVLFGAIMEMTVVAVHNQDRISHRVDANSRARPTLTRVMDNLRSGCVAPRVAPIQQGSTSTQMAYLSRSGSDVSLTPDRRVLTFLPASGSVPARLREEVFPATGGTPPVWTFSSTALTSSQFVSPPNPRRMPPVYLEDVTPPGGVGFRYFRYVNGQLSTTPLAVPLSSTDAALTAYVTVSLNIQPSRGTTSSSDDQLAPITITDSVDLRLESANQVAAVDNPPCT